MRVAVVVEEKRVRVQGPPVCKAGAARDDVSPAAVHAHAARCTAGKTSVLRRQRRRTLPELVAMCTPKRLGRLKVVASCKSHIGALGAGGEGGKRFRGRRRLTLRAIHRMPHQWGASFD